MAEPQYTKYILKGIHILSTLNQRDTGSRNLIYPFFIILFLSLCCVDAFSDEQKQYSNDQALLIIENIKERLSAGEELSEEEWKALVILDSEQQETKPIYEMETPVAYKRKELFEKEGYRSIGGTQSALGNVIDDDILCEQKLYDNQDGSTFTYLRKTIEGYIEKWVFLKNANPFYWANYWNDIENKLKGLVNNGSQLKYQLPPSKVLIEIVKLSKLCPFEVSSITGTDIKIFNTETVVPYWSNEEYFFTNSDTTQYAAIVSLYYAKRGRQNKNNFALIWPCYLASREKSGTFKSRE